MRNCQRPLEIVLLYSTVPVHGTVIVTVTRVIRVCMFTHTLHDYSMVPSTVYCSQLNLEYSSALSENKAMRPTAGAQTASLKHNQTFFLQII